MASLLGIATAFLLTRKSGGYNPPPLSTSGVILGYFHGNNIKDLNSRGVLDSSIFAPYTHVTLQGYSATSKTDATLIPYAGVTPTYIGLCLHYAHAVGCKVLLTLFSGSSAKFLRSIGLSTTLRAQVMSQISTIMKTSYNGEYLDGIDYDIEGEADTATATTNLIRDTRNIIGDSKILTCVGFHYEPNMYGFNLPNIDPSVANLLDYVNLMTYGFGANSNIYHSSYEDSIDSMQRWINFGFPANKLLMGIPFYCEDTAGGSAIVWEDLLKAHPDWDYVNQDTHPATAVTSIRTGLNYSVSGGVLWVGSLALDNQKVQGVHNLGCGGIMIYAVGEDYYGGQLKITNINNQVKTLWE
jgi:hypothetical protein